jgi:hypothetical protein
MYFFKVPSSRFNGVGSQIIQCRQNNGKEWIYSRKLGSYTHDVCVPKNASIYHVEDELMEITLLANAEPTDINGLKVLFVPKSIAEEICPVEINRSEPKSLGERIDTFLDKNIP